MGGMVGRLLREFAVTLSTAIMISLGVSLTTTPMMCAHFLRFEQSKVHGTLYTAVEHIFNQMRKGYDLTLRWALRHARFMLTVTLFTIGFNIYLFIVIPKGFFPEQDIGRITGNIQAEQDISFQAMKKKMATLVDIIRRDPDVMYVLAFTGGSGGGSATVNTGRMFISLKPFAKRKATAQQVISRLRPKFAGVVGAPTFLQPVQELRIGGMASSAFYQYTLKAANLKDLNVWAPRVLQQMRGLSELTDVNSDQQDKGLEVSLVIDRDTASRFGITPQLIDQTLHEAFGQEQVSIMYTLLNQYHVVMEVEPRFWQRPETLRDIYVSSPTGATVPLSAFTHYQRTTTSLS